MKISKIKKKLEKLFGGKPKDNEENIECMLTLIDLLKEKQRKLKSKLELAEQDEDKQDIKRKLKLVKKQLLKADEHIVKLRAEDGET